MVLRTITYNGTNTVDNEVLDNFQLDPIKGLVFTPSIPNTKVDGLGYRPHQVTDTQSPQWLSVSYDITRDTNITPADFRLLTTLYGINDHGSYEMMGEDLITTCSTTESTETRNFLFHKCTNKPYFSIDTGTASTGKINLNLPYRAEYLQALNLYRVYTYYDDFEDGQYGYDYLSTGPVRSTPYQDWIKRGGTVTMENSTPIRGTYSLKHTGAGTDSITNRLQLSGGHPNITCFDFKVTTQGSMTTTPQFWLWVLRYQDTNNYVVLDTYYDSGTNKQKLRLWRMVGGSAYDLSTIDWMTGKLPLNTIYNFNIINTSSNYKIFVNGIEKISYNYTTLGVSTGTFGFGANKDSAGVWDNINYYINESDNQFSTAINSDSVSAEDMVASFTLPSYFGNNNPVRFGYQRKGNNEYRGNTVSVSPTNSVRMGYQGLDNYKTLGLKFESTCSDEYTFNINNIVFKYET